MTEPAILYIHVAFLRRCQLFLHCYPPSISPSLTSSLSLPLQLSLPHSLPPTSMPASLPPCLPLYLPLSQSSSCICSIYPFLFPIILFSLLLYFHFSILLFLSNFLCPLSHSPYSFPPSHPFSPFSFFLPIVSTSLTHLSEVLFELFMVAEWQQYHGFYRLICKNEISSRVASRYCMEGASNQRRISSKHVFNHNSSVKDYLAVLVSHSSFNHML